MNKYSCHDKRPQNCVLSDQTMVMEVIRIFIQPKMQRQQLPIEILLVIY